jgi:tetratricopeptide (TPR) repeat protein
MRRPAAARALSLVAPAAVAALLSLPALAGKAVAPSAPPVEPGAVAAPSPAAAPGAVPGTPPAAGSDLDIWKDPEFRKSFMGSYGVLAEREPKLTPQEREALEKVVPLLGTDLTAAAAALAALVKPDASALFDFTLGNVQFQLDRIDEAKQSYQNAVQKLPTFLRAWKNLGLLAIRTGDMPGAVRALTKMIELGGGDGLTYGLLGQAYASRGDFLSAESAYRQALLLSPDSLDWKLGLTRCLFKEERYAEAADLCGDLIAKHPERTDLMVLQASAFLGMKEPRRAAQNYEILARSGHATTEILYALGDIYVNESLMDLAANAYIRALDLDPGQSPARAFRAAEALAARGALEPASLVIARMRTVFVDRAGSADAGADGGAGESHLEEGDKRRLLKLQARIDVAQGAGDKAVGVLEEIVALDPLDGEALMLLGQFYSRSAQPEKAAFYYERAASLEAFEADAKVRLAQILVGQGKYGEAVTLLKRSQELKPRDEIARYLDQVERVARAHR